MSDAVAYILRGAQSVFAGYGALYVASAIFWPTWFIDNISINHLRERHNRRDALKHGLRNISNARPWYEMPTAILTMISVGVLAYAAAYALIAFVPYSWGGENEDGEWQSARYVCQSTIALWATLALVSRLETNAEALVQGVIERVARQVLTAAIRSSCPPSSDANASILQAVDSELTPGSDRKDSIEYDYGLLLHHSISSGIRL